MSRGFKSFYGGHIHVAEVFWRRPDGTVKVICITLLCAHDGSKEGSQSSVVSKGKPNVHYCPKGHKHTMVNDHEEDLVYFAVVPEQ